MKYEKPQKGNPNQLTVMQHVFPCASIKRFCNADGCVELHLIGQEKVLQVKPEDQLFCAQRAWDQKSESGYMKSIEDSFQDIVSNILNNPEGIKFTQSETQNITRFYSLWYLRHYYKMNLEKDLNLHPPYEGGWTKDEQEQLEKAGAMYINNNGSYPGRYMAGCNLITQINDIRGQVLDAEWGVLRSLNIEFIVPDRPFDFLSIPITPKICLYPKSRNMAISDKQVSFINSHVKKSCTNYYFAKELSKCVENA